jgi:hypothetical protein
MPCQDIFFEGHISTHSSGIVGAADVHSEAPLPPHQGGLSGGGEGTGSLSPARRAQEAQMQNPVLEKIQ